MSEVELALYLMFCNIILRCIVTVVAATAVSLYYDEWWLSERLGMGLMGGCSFLTIPVIIGTMYGHRTPFDDWASAVMSLGLVLFMSGRLARTARHARINRKAKMLAEAHLIERGKL